MNDLLDFSGKTVLVVGGSSGIGNGTAQAFRARGADVHVWGTRPNAADYAGEEGSDLAGLHYDCVDVSDPEAVDAAPSFEKLDVLILCQGAVRYGRAEFTREGWNEVISVNLNSVMDCARKFHPALKQAGGSLQIISSTAAYHATIGNPAYGASKAGAVALVRNLAVAWARDGIRVNGLAPGFVKTKMTKVTFDDETRAEQAVRKIPLRRTGEPSELANAALFLASPMASYIIGQTIPVDGGLSLG
ncbi:SDR family NAD(P)-dependent oxidoreductase [Pontixanthobacter aquaemixtae]|uniref:SDR family oxidoreductase n=1 Tax=Pontixanthobacter aquaemixtae TaxID=1958940 RepID=A0A844ZWD0_9SPHN|nr:SDR family NAD(P)-dependent oxidoreductase [Pontixanthobacter aquaemixtae]MXO91562.1 SDR family oxidoreductase [Pontixanthobacter aquaemixtae]